MLVGAVMQGMLINDSVQHALHAEPAGCGNDGI